MHYFETEPYLVCVDSQRTLLVLISVKRDRGVVGQMWGDPGPESSMKGPLHSPLFVGKGYMHGYTQGRRGCSTQFCVLNSEARAGLRTCKLSEASCFHRRFGLCVEKTAKRS